MPCMKNFCKILIWFLLLQTPLSNSVPELYIDDHHHIAAPTPTITNTVRKHIHFPSFTLDFTNPNPTTNQIKLLGSASISQEKGIIQIPNPSPPVDLAYQAAGRAIFSSPIRLFDPRTQATASFNTTFSFHLSKAGPRSGAGGGLAFLIAPDEFTVGRPGPWLGILNDACNHYKVFAVEFDNSHDPEVGDPNDDHIGINLGSVVSTKLGNLSGTNISLHDNLVLRAWIFYDGHRKWLQVFIGLNGGDQNLPPKPFLSSKLDLAPFLKEYMFVGFSASSKNSTQIHNILSWDFSSISNAFLDFPSRHACQRNVAHQVSKFNHSSPPSSFFIFLCICGLITVAFINLYCNSMPSQTESKLALLYPDIKQRPLLPGTARGFSLFEVRRATQNFSKNMVLGSGLTGVLYKAVVRKGHYVAMKRYAVAQFLNSPMLEYQRQIMKRISAINRTCTHPHLALIRGWCFEYHEMILVYDYFQNGTLDQWLFQGVGVLPWTRRFKFIKDIAVALSFLHSKELTHGNLSTSNVYIDVSYNAILGDYGFLHLPEETSLSGTESVTGKKSDVFGFGILVLKIVSGKRSSKMDQSNNGDQGEDNNLSLLKFAWEMHECGEKERVVDERMGSSVNLEEALMVLDVGLICTLDGNVNSRPSMAEVVQFLNMQKKQIPKLPPFGPHHAKLLPKPKTRCAI